MVATLTSGRNAVERRAWEEAREVFAEVDQSEPLAPDDLELMADAAWWTGHPDEATAALERAYAGRLEADQPVGAAFVALRLGYLAVRRLAVSVGIGWLAQAERLLEDQPESAAHGYLRLFQAAAALFGQRDPEAALTSAEIALELGRKHGSRDVQALALSLKGVVLISRGEWQEGLALIDEATAAAVSGELDLRAASDVYCNTIAACRDLGDYRRAGEWTEEADRWMRRQSLGGYPGICRVHRAELKRLRGSWSEAEREARRACEELEIFHLMDGVGFAYYEIGEVRLRMGDLAAAEESFERAYSYGHDPQPGLALLLLAQGQVDEAAKSISRSLTGEEYEPGEGQQGDLLRRVRLLPAQVEIALVRDDLDTARKAVEELEIIAQRFQQPVFEAASLAARGAVQVKEGSLEGAVRTLGRAWRLYHEIELPYESARARMLLGQAHSEAGEKTTARLELRAARSVFQRLGAVLDLDRVADLLAEEGGVGERRRVTKTFMFTDIVTSTDLVRLIGDAAWEELLQWHDRTLRSAFSRHSGEVVSHTGDGFFVAFDQAGAAIECGVAIQRSLVDHRRHHGFAPWVRIGLHTAEATPQGTDYRGQGVHVAARVGAVADGEEIVVSAPVLEAAGVIRFPTSDAQEVELKGIDEPVKVHKVDWRRG